MEKIIGIFAGVLTSASMLPQFFKLIQKKDSKDISLGMLCVLIAGVACWVWYGFLLDNMIIIATNAFALLTNLLTLGLAIIFRRK